MEPGRIAALTDAQREALRLLRTHRNAKAIGRRLGITHWAVHERLRAARRVLGAASSFEAAELLARAEAEPAYHRFVYDAGPLAGPADPLPATASAEGDQQLRPGAYLLREERTPFGSASVFSHWPRLPVPRFRGDRNDLTIRARLLWIGALAAGVVIMVGALVSIAYGAGRIIAHLIRAFA